MTKTVVLSACVTTIAVSIVVGGRIGLEKLGTWITETPPIEGSVLRRIVPGMSTTAVSEILGEPSEVSASGSERTWCYERFPQLVLVVIRFDGNGEVIDVAVGD